MSRGQHHRGLAIVTAAGLGIAALVGLSGVVLPRGESLWHMIAGPEVDGNWRFVSVDGVDVSTGGYTLGILWGKVTGYTDGCNSCGISFEERGIYHMRTCTLQACEEKPTDALVRGFFQREPGPMEVVGDRLVITRGGSRAVLVREGG